MSGLKGNVEKSAAVMLQQVREYERAHNCYDVKKATALFTEDIQFETVGEWVMAGKKKIQDLEEWDAALSNHLAFTDVRANGDTVICKAVEHNDLLKLAGFKQIRYDSVALEFRGDLIKKITAKTAEEDQVATSKMFHSMVEWAMRQRHGEIVKLVSDGKFAYNARNAKGWLVLMQEWLRTKDQPWR